ncbi:MAG: NADH-quinone oxidoreductase subunit NuoG [Chloroflexota bacterium]
MEEAVSLTVNGKQIQAAKNTLLWEACKANGIDIPIFCYHTKLGPVGACRTCLVEQAGVAKGPITACSTPVSEGMVIRTQSAVVEKAQKGIFEFLLANHPLDCPICDRAGECPLQDQTFAYGPGVSRYVEPKRHHVKPIVLGPTIALDRERCVLCWRCVRFCAEVAEDKSIILLDRGDHSAVGTYQNEPYVNNFSGNVVELCPVGALTSIKQRFNFRPWELQNRPSICPHCPMGCNINVSVRKNDEVIRFLSRDNLDVDNSWLCDRGRFNFDFINSDQRLTSPMIRRDEGFVQVSWNEALDFIARKLKAVLAAEESDSMIGIASPRLTNEDLFVFKRFMNQVMRTGNVDHVPRPEFAPGADPEGSLQRLNTRLTSIAALQRAGAILLLGANPSLREPVMELRIREAVNQNGAKLVTLETEETPLSSKAAARVRCGASNISDALSRLTAAVRSEGHQPASDIDLAAEILRNGPIVVVYDDTLAAADGTAGTLTAIAELADTLAEHGEVGTLPLLEDCNSMGARDLRMLPNGAWNRSLMRRLRDDSATLKVAYILGSNVVRDAGPELAARLRGLELVVVHELMMTETALCADVVLPAASFAEKTGTFTNTERRVQMLTPAVPSRGIARTDWEILVDLSQAFENPLEYSFPQEVWADIRNVVPDYEALSYQDLGPQGVRPADPQPAVGV